MFQFPAFAHCLQCGIASQYRVAPFGNSGIKGYLHLPRTYRSLSRPSSPPRAKASTVCPSLTSFPFLSQQNQFKIQNSKFKIPQSRQGFNMGRIQNHNFKVIRRIDLSLASTTLFESYSASISIRLHLLICLSRFILSNMSKNS